MALSDPKTRMAAEPDTSAAAVGSSAPASRMSLRRKLLLLALLCALLLFGGYKAVKWFTVGRFIQTTENAYVEADISVIAPRVQGYVREVLVKDNQSVRAGDVLARIDDSELRAKLVQAQAGVATRRAGIDNVSASSARQQSVIAAARSEIDSRQAEGRRASADLARFEQLRKDGWASQQRVQQVEADARKASADLASAAAGLRGQKSQLNVLSSQGKMALAYYKEAIAAVEVAQLELDNSVLRAPIDGVIGNKAVRVGQFVKPGTILMAVVPLSDVYVTANFKETQLAKVRIGQKVSLHIDAYDDASFEGVIDSISPATGSRFSMLPPENATGNFTKVVQRLPVKIRLTNVPKDYRLTPGLSVEVSINTRQ
jgi:membrane fusion protein, multidrug efflux system